MAARTRNVLLLLLSLAAGCVDAIAFVNAGVFPANMTGNSVVLALAVAQAHPTGVAQSALALAGFCAGAAIGAWMARPPLDGQTWSRGVTVALAFAGFLVSACAVMLWLSNGKALPLNIVAAATAMGLQSASVLRLGVSGISTVVVTGTLTSSIVRAVDKGARAAHASRSASGAWLPASSAIAYFAGATGGALQSALHLNAMIAAPGLLILAVALIAAISGPPLGRNSAPGQEPKAT